MKPPLSVADRVSRETLGRLEILAAELVRWQRAVNLVSRASLPELWSRHIDDCLQISELAPAAVSWLDLGSGAGLPGLVVAAADATRSVTLIESDTRKCAFLRSTAAAMGLSVHVQEGRIERVLPDIDHTPDVVTARALAPLTSLLDYAQALLARGAIGLFPKGRGYAHELTLARESWTFKADVVASRTDSEARILRIHGFSETRPDPAFRDLGGA